jgi:phage RecT family recombinase
MSQHETGIVLLRDKEFWGKVEKQITRMMDRAIRLQPQQLLMAAHFSIENNRNLQECSRFSLAQSIIEAGMYGLHLGPALGQSFLIPYKQDCKMIVGYKGFGTLAARANLPMSGHAVYSNDEFDLDYGRPQPVIHRPFVSKGDKPEDRGHLIGTYALVNVQGVCIVRWHDRKEIERRRGFSKFKGPDSVWAKFYEAMAEKGPRRDLGAKDVPLDLAPRLVEASSVDERREFNVADAEPSETEQKAREAAAEVSPEPEEPAKAEATNGFQDVTGDLMVVVSRGKSLFVTIGGKEYQVADATNLKESAIKRQGKRVVAHLKDGKVVSMENAQ